MTILSWAFGLIGLPGALALGLAVVFLPSVFASIAKWVWIAVLVAVAGWGAAGYGKAALAERQAVKAQAELDKTAAALKTKTDEFGGYVAQVGAAAAAEQQARQTREGAYRDRESSITTVAAGRAAADRADAQRLLDSAVRLTARAAQDRRAIEAAAAAGDGASNARRAGVYADVLEGCRQSYADMAAAAQRARSAGSECEARYDSAAALTGALSR